MLLDEPAAALTGGEIEFLKRLITKTRERVAIIYVSHRLQKCWSSAIASMFSRMSLWSPRGRNSSIASIFKASRSRERRWTSPSIAAMNEAGVGYLPPDRRGDVIPVLSVAANMTLARLTRADAGMLLDPGTELRDVEERIRALAIKDPRRRRTGERAGRRQSAKGASRPLAHAQRESSGARQSDQRRRRRREGGNLWLLRYIAAQGVGVLLVSDDLVEIIGLSKRILVMRGGEIALERDAPRGAKPREADVVSHLV